MQNKFWPEDPILGETCLPVDEHSPARQPHSGGNQNGPALKSPLSFAPRHTPSPGAPDTDNHLSGLRSGVRFSNSRSEKMLGEIS